MKKYYTDFTYCPGIENCDKCKHCKRFLNECPDIELWWQYPPMIRQTKECKTFINIDDE